MQRTDGQLRKDAALNRQRILDAASEAFAEHGLDVTLNDVAAWAGVGVGTVYRRFANKEELIDELFERRLDRLGELAAEVGEDPDAWHALTTFLEGSMQLMLEDRGFMEILQNPDHGLTRVALATRTSRPADHRDRRPRPAARESSARTSPTPTSRSSSSHSARSSTEHARRSRSSTAVTSRCSSMACAPTAAQSHHSRSNR